MSLLNPKQIYEVLQEAKPPRPQAPAGSRAEAINLTELLTKNGLSPDEVLEQVSHNMISGETGNVRLSAAKVALQLNGLLDSDNAKPDFHVNITIMDSEFSGMNPILMPR